MLDAELTETVAGKNLHKMILTQQWLMFDPTGKETPEQIQSPRQERKGSCGGDRKGQLGPRKGSKTMALMSSACLGLVPPGPKQQQTQLAFSVLIELQGSQGSLNDCKSGKCK